MTNIAIQTDRLSKRYQIGALRAPTSSTLQEVILGALRRPFSNHQRGLEGQTATTLWALKAAMERGGFTRQGINTALETRIRGLPTPGGRLYFGPRNHSGIQIGSMWAGRIASCKPVAVFGAAFKK